jgi:tetratricopeptide (TPR) repeat protein
MDPGRLPHAERLEAWTDRALDLAGEHDQTSEVQALEDAVQLFEAVVAASDGEDPERARYLDNLGVALLTRFELLRRPEDLRRALAQERAARDVQTPAHPDRALHLSNLCNTALVSYGVSGDQGELDEAIAAGTAAVQLASADDPDRPMYQANLVAAQTARFESLAQSSSRLLREVIRTGEASQLDQAVAVGRAAIAAIPSDDPRRASVLSNTSHALRLRYEWAGEEADLDAAVELARAAAALDGVGEIGLHVNHLVNLGGALLARFHARGEPGDAAEAVEVCRRAVSLTAPDQPDRAVALSNLAGALQARALDRSDADVQLRQDLDEAVAACRQAAEIAPEGTDRAVYLGNLTNALLSRYARRGSAAGPDLDEAIAAAGRSLRGLPAGGADWARVTANLAVALAERSRASGTAEDSARAVSQWRALGQTASVPAAVRLAAARDAVDLAAGSGDRRAAADAAAVTVDLLPLVTWRGLQWKSRAGQLARWAGVATDAAALTIQAGQPAGALLLVEHGRSVLWGQSLDLRSDLTGLATAAPVYARRLARIRELLDLPAATSLGSLELV